MEEKNKNIEDNKSKSKVKLYLVIVISILVLVGLGYFIYNKVANSYKEYLDTIEISGDAHKITNLSLRLESATFLNNQTEETVYKGPNKYKHTIKIVNNKVVIITENNKIEIESINNPVSVSLISNYSYSETDGIAYVLNDEGKIYRILYSTDQSKNASRDYMYSDVTEYELPKVESYTINAGYLGDYESNSFFVIAKTYDNKYYTDYFFVSFFSPQNYLKEIVDVSLSNQNNYDTVKGYKGLLLDTGGYNYDSKCNTTDTVSFHTTTKKIECYYSSSERYILYKDNYELKIYDLQKNKYYIVNITVKNGINYNLVAPNEELVGITYSEQGQEKYSFYSLVNGKIMYKNKYEFLDILNKNYLATYDSVGESKSAYVLSTTSEKIVLTEKNKCDNGNLFFSDMDNNNNYITLVCVQEEEEYVKNIKKIYTSDLKVILDDFKDVTGVYSDKNNNLVIVKNYNKIITYDKSGKVINTNEKYSKVLNVYEDYIIYQDSNNIKYSKDNKELGTVLELKDKEEVSYAFMDANQITITTRSESVTVDDVWNDCKNNYVCEETTKDTIKDCEFGYSYVYDLKTKKTTKYADIVGYCGNE